MNFLIFDILYSRDSGISLGYCHELRQTRNDFIGLSSGLAAAVWRWSRRIRLAGRKVVVMVERFGAEHTAGLLVMGMRVMVESSGALYMGPLRWPNSRRRPTVWLGWARAAWRLLLAAAVGLNHRGSIITYCRLKRWAVRARRAWNKRNDILEAFNATHATPFQHKTAGKKQN